MHTEDEESIKVLMGAVKIRNLALIVLDVHPLSYLVK